MKFDITRCSQRKAALNTSTLGGTQSATAAQDRAEDCYGQFGNVSSLLSHCQKGQTLFLLRFSFSDFFPAFFPPSYKFFFLFYHYKVIVILCLGHSMEFWLSHLKEDTARVHRGIKMAINILKMWASWNTRTG